VEGIGKGRAARAGEGVHFAQHRQVLLAQLQEALARRDLAFVQPDLAGDQFGRIVDVAHAHAPAWRRRGRHIAMSICSIRC
jgi:hypothetical protein